MSIVELPIVGQLYLPFILTSLIIGMVILILLEKKKKAVENESKTSKATAATLKNNTSQDTHSQGIDTPSSKGGLTQGRIQENGIDAGTTKDEVMEENHKTKESDELGDLNTSQGREDVVVGSSSCASSGSEEEASRPRKVSRKPKKKHACKGSAIICATKRKVTAVTIMTDSQEEVQASLEHLSREIRSEGVTCSVLTVTTDTHLTPQNNEPSHLLLLFGTSSEGCQRLKAALTPATIDGSGGGGDGSDGGGSGGGGDGGVGVGVSSSPAQPFLFSVTCWSAAASGDIFECAKDLSVWLGVCGGAEWLPITCITTANEGETEPPVMDRQHYLTTVMDKITKPAKKCCGTSCGSKTVDIEDLASSLIQPSAAVTS